jgi:glycosyltransferase involved in cell wall biosynthesis
MRVLSIGLDPKILDPESPAAFRSRAYRRITDYYGVVVPTPEPMTVPLSDTVTAYGTGGHTKVVRLLRLILLVRSLIVKEKVDVIATSDPYFIGFVCLLLARVYHCGLEIQVLGLEKNSQFRTVIACYVLKHASVVRALSNRLYERLHIEYRVPYDHMRIVTIYVDTQKLGFGLSTQSEHEDRAFRTRVTDFKSRYKGRVNFLTVSRLVSIKNISLQLRAVARLKHAHPEVLLHVVGGGPEEHTLKEEAKRLGIVDHVLFHGPQYGYELGAFYAGADCFMLTSHYEGWGMVVVEALAAGLPVIMTAVGCADELVKNGESGIVIPVGNTDALTEAMKRMIVDIPYRTELSRGTSRALGSLPNLTTVLHMYKEHWERALSRRH